jgi:anti-sigma factor RsiW
MNEHTETLDLLTLAAAGALDADEQRRVEEHLRGCAACKAEFDTWCEITGALRELPTPEAPSGLVERTRRQLVNQAAARREHRWNQLIIGFLIVFAWALTLLTWPVLQLVGNKLGQWLDISYTSITLACIVYTVAAWLATGVVAVFVGKRYHQEGRTA